MNTEFSKFHPQHSEQGQTLIETMVASMVLIVGIGAAVGLAVYGLATTSSVTKQLIGVGLAREGIEAVKNMRDTNWLQDNLQTNCWNYYTQALDGSCYPNWLNGGPYNINPGGTPTTYALGFNAGAGEIYYWYWIQTNSRFGLNYTPNNPSEGLYSISGLGVPVSSSTSGFARKITLTPENFAPFDQATLGPRLKVTVDVWWKDKRCGDFTNIPPTIQSCKVTLETYLTNWKDY